MERRESQSSPIGICEYLIYYKKKPSTLKPMATLIGTIIDQFDNTEDKLKETDSGTIRTVLINSSDININSEAETVRQSPDVTVIWSDSDCGLIDVIGESGSGFTFGKNSVLKVKGNLYFSKDQEVIEKMTGTNRVMVKKGKLHVTIGDNRVVVNTNGSKVVVEDDSAKTVSVKTWKATKDKSIGPKTSFRASGETTPRIHPKDTSMPIPERLSQSQNPMTA